MSEKLQKLQKLEESRRRVAEAYRNMLFITFEGQGGESIIESILDDLTEVYIGLGNQIKTIKSEVSSNG
jgi:hypothetical protein